jgi:hypothetical protein
MLVMNKIAFKTVSLQPKRRRSSAQPALGGTSRRAAATPVDVTLVEESEEELPAKKVGRRKKIVSGVTMKLSVLIQCLVNRWHSSAPAIQCCQF